MKSSHTAAGTLIERTDPHKNRRSPDEWVDQYGDYLYRYAMMRLKDPIAVQDVLQETYIAGIKGLEKFDGRVEIKYWLRGILRNKIVDHIRKSVRERPYENPMEHGEDDGIEGEHLCHGVWEAALAA